MDAEQRKLPGTNWSSWAGGVDDMFEAVRVCLTPAAGSLKLRGKQQRMVVDTTVSHNMSYFYHRITMTKMDS